jgi:electron transfer flavoprotein beta subunit
VKILVAIKRVIDPDARIRLNADATGVDQESVEYKVNPFCENAIEAALVLQAAHGAEVVLVTVGPEEVTQTIRSGLAMGADRAIRVEGLDNDLDSDLVARILVAVAGREKPDIILLGKQAVDGDNNQVGQLLAEYLGCGQACFASELAIDGDRATVTREVDGGLETLSIPLPVVVTADLRLNEPRYASLPGIMKAKRKTIDILTTDELGVSDTALKIELVSLELPTARQAGVMVESVDDLLDKLKNEARVL